MSYFAAGGTNSGAHPRRCRGGTPLSGVSLRPSGRTPPGSRINCQTSSDHLLSLVRKGYRIGEAEREQSVARGASGFLTRLTRVGQRSPGVPQPQRRADARRDLRSATAASPAPASTSRIFRSAFPLRAEAARPRGPRTPTPRAPPRGPRSRTQRCRDRPVPPAPRPTPSQPLPPLTRPPARPR